MSTLTQSARGCRIPKRRRLKLLPLDGSPFKKGVCRLIRTVKPKKPNSAQRKTAKVELSNKRLVLCYIPGQGHKLQEYSVVLVRGGRVPDLPGIKYHLIRGLFDFTTKEEIFRNAARSKYGIKYKDIIEEEEARKAIFKKKKITRIKKVVPKPDYYSTDVPAFVQNLSRRRNKQKKIF